MKIYGLLGHNITYSLSPAMHNAAFKKLGLDTVYKIFDVEPQKLKSFLNDLLRSNISGLNITIPYKQEVYNFIEKYGVLDTEAKKLGAINTIVIKHNKLLFGYNTDTTGFMESLKKDLGFNPRMKNIFIFGAGGAGTACALKLAQVSKRISICDIDEKKIRVFKNRFFEHFGKSKLNVVRCKVGEINKVLKECELIVNATPYGRKGNERLVNPEGLHKGLVVFDLIYNPQVTPLIRDARKLGLKAVNGLSMLLYQGAASFELWTGKKAPVGTMREALKKELKNQKSKIKN